MPKAAPIPPPKKNLFETVDLGLAAGSGVDSGASGDWAKAGIARARTAAATASFLTAMDSRTIEARPRILLT